MRSFKSNENIHKKEGGSYYVVSANKASSVTLQGNFSVVEIQLFLILYAGDQVLHVFATSFTTLQLMRNDIERYRNAWGLKINVSKTNLLIF